MLDAVAAGHDASRTHCLGGGERCCCELRNGRSALMTGCPLVTLRSPYDEPTGHVAGTRMGSRRSRNLSGQMRTPARHKIVTPGVAGLEMVKPSRSELGEFDQVAIRVTHRSDL